MEMLREAVPADWLPKVLRNLPAILIDHAHLERKAATTALNLEKYRDLYPRVEELNAKDVPSGAILSLEQALHQPQMNHRKVLKKVPLEGFGEVEVFGLTAQFEKTPGTVETAPPVLGEHNAEIYSGLGISEIEQAELKATGVI